MKLEELKKGLQVEGVVPEQAVEVVDVMWHGNDTVELTYKDSEGRTVNALLDRDTESLLELATLQRSWSFTSDAQSFLLAAEARRIKLASLFDPYAAIHSSLIDPLPHQISAVYEAMLPRYPLRFLLADDPGAGKTIMAGLLIKELRIRGDLRKCLIVAPGSLVEQWQDELDQKMALPFDQITREGLEASRSGNAFVDMPLAIARLDMLSRDEGTRWLATQVDWDLVIIDEAHKASATYFGNEAKYTKRYRLVEELGSSCRNLLLLTATPHNGKEEDFQLFLKLLDADRFEGKYRPGVHTGSPGDLMRRMVKEDLVTFDNKPLFPERHAYTVEYELSPGEAGLYEEVTDYVQHQMNRAKQTADGSRRTVVGWALTILQRRLASSPAAIHESLKRRKARLERTLEEARETEDLARTGDHPTVAQALDSERLLDSIDDFDDDLNDEEREEAEDEIVDAATAAQTVAELEGEISTLEHLERLAARVRGSATDSKWTQLRSILEGESERTGSPKVSVYDAEGNRRKLVIFTEHKDTLHYLVDRIRNLLGRQESVVAIFGGMPRDQRRRVQELFTQDRDTAILVATDAAGEGINLQRANLMVNYDLPWNPNRLEQRFGRIHRIGQTEVCHLWNLVAYETREGDVYVRLLRKLEAEGEALEGRIFDVLGKLFREHSLRQMLLDAIEYGDRPEVRARLHQQVDEATDHSRLVELCERDALASGPLSRPTLQNIRDDMERAALRRLQPHFVAAFVKQSLVALGGRLSEREPGRWEIRRVPVSVRSQESPGRRAPVLDRYQRVTFQPDLVQSPGKAMADLIAPGHPLLDALLKATLEKYGLALKRGTVLIDENDLGTDVRVLFLCDSDVEQAPRQGEGPEVVSRRTTMVEVTEYGDITDAGWAPYLDYRPISSDELNAVSADLEQAWLGADLESRALTYASQVLTKKHFDEVSRRITAANDRIRAAVTDRLGKEIEYWDARAATLKEEELSGKVNARLNSALCARRAQELEARLSMRLEALDRETRLIRKPAVMAGAALVIPAGLLSERGAASPGLTYPDQETRDLLDQLAIKAVCAAERRLDCDPHVMTHNHPGYDIESRQRSTGELRFIEVKGVGEGKEEVSVSYNQVLEGANSPDQFILAVVQIQDGIPREPRYVRRVFEVPQPGISRVQFKLDWLLAHSSGPA